MTETDDLEGVRARTRALCSQFPDEYWRETDLNRRYPQEFVRHPDRCRVAWPP